MGKIISFINQKGGVGKTTTCVNVASYMATFGKKVFSDLHSQKLVQKYTGKGRFAFENTVFWKKMQNVQRREK